jgi:hypothetical protein
MVFRAIACWLLLLLPAAGCNHGRVTVQGEVTVAGKPLESGSICFEPADGKGATCGGGISAGRFELSSSEGVFPGKKIVRITAVQKAGKKISAGPPLPPGSMIEETKVSKLPPQEVEVVEGQANVFSFDL